MRVHACPVRFYYERNEPLAESDRYAVCKQLSYHLGTPLDAEAVWNEVSSVKPGIDTALREYLDLCVASCTRQEWKVALETDVRVVSEKHGIAGMIDRVTGDGAFSVIRATGALPMGTYSADRLRVAALALCLEEMTGRDVAGGTIEHIPDGIARYHDVQPRDRRQVLTSLHKYHAIMDGRLPEPPLNAPCNRCRYKDRCASSTGRRLSELL